MGGKFQQRMARGGILLKSATFSTALIIAASVFLFSAAALENRQDAGRLAADPVESLYLDQGAQQQQSPSGGTPESAVVAEDGSGKPAYSSPASPLKLRSEEYGSEVYAGITLADGQPATVRWDGANGTPAFLSGSIAPPAAASPAEAAIAFLAGNVELYRLSDPAAELRVSRQERDDLGMTHVHFEQMHQGVPVFGSDIAVHFAGDGRIVTVNGRYVPDINIAATPGIAAEAAVAAALADLSVEAAVSEKAPELFVLTPAGEEPVLAWQVTLTGDEPPLKMVYFIDARTGKVAGSYDAMEDVKNRKTYTANSGTSLPGTLLINEGGSSADSVAQAAHNNTGITYDYYYGTFTRDSFNGSGATMTTTVHYSNRYNNAFWNGSQMVYGDGDGSVFGPLGNSLDVVAHELTHAVTQYSAGLVYSYQSGALNESYSDVFGVMVDRDDWLLGEDVYTPNTPGDALRSLSNPALFGQPAHMNDYVNTTSDNGGVHINSGIPNKAAYNVAQSIGKEKMEKIWYRTLTVYLNSGSQFTDARDASVQAAIDLYGSGSPEVTAVQNGFSAVGIGGTQTSDTTARVEIDHTYRGDLVVTLGVGDPTAPAWSTVVSNRQGGSGDNVYTTVDIAGGVASLPPSWQNRWFLKVYDAAGYDTGQIRKFAITDHGTTYTATDTPVAVNDYETVYSFIPTNDSTPPTVTATSPASGASGVYARSNVTATFSEPVAAGTVNTSSFTLANQQTGAPVTAQVTYDSSTRTAVLNPDADLAYSTAYVASVSTAVTDEAGNPMAQSHQWSFTTAPPPKNYYFTWYDMKSTSMQDWVVLGNPSSATASAGFDVAVGGSLLTSIPVSVQPGQTTPVTAPGTIGGPVKVSSLDGSSKIVSKRTLYGNSFEELNAMAESRLDSHYYFTWYDARSPGARNWIMIANPGTSAVEADIYIAGSRMNQTPYRIEAGASVTSEFRGLMGGQVEIVAYEPGSPSVPRDVLASQRVLWNGEFNEVTGIPAAELHNQYFFAWYDQQSPGARTWLLVGNPDSSRELAAEIWIGGQRMENPATGEQFFTVPAGESITPVFPGVMNGPVEVRGYDAATYSPASPGSPNMDFYTSERSIFGSSFEEVSGYAANRLSPVYFFSWYDQRSTGSRDWVMVTNPSAGEVKAEIWIAGTRMTTLTIAPGASQTPSFPGVMSGPVEVRGYDSATYNPSSPGTPNRNVFTSQRVLWNGSFNEVEGMVLD